MLFGTTVVSWYADGLNGRSGPFWVS